MEYIDKDALRKALFNGEQNLYAWEEIEAKIDSIPAADVAPIVYCKDCYWWYTDKTTDGTVDLSHCSRGVSAGNGQYFYCALGQRRVNLKDGNR